MACRSNPVLIEHGWTFLHYSLQERDSNPLFSAYEAGEMPLFYPAVPTSNSPTLHGHALVVRLLVADLSGLEPETLRLTVGRSAIELGVKTLVADIRIPLADVWVHHPCCTY